jgi:hypothetical protein
MIALEMSAPDRFDIDDPSDTDQIEVAELPPADPVIVARQPEPPAAPAIAPSLQPSLQPSLGHPIKLHVKLCPNLPRTLL